MSTKSEKRFLLSVDPGLEDVVVSELHEQSRSSRATENPFGLPGQVLVETDEPAPLLQLTTIHHVLEVLAEEPVEGLADIQSVLDKTAFDLLGDAGSFRVTSNILGDIGLEKFELQRAAGAALVRRFATPVSLEEFDVEIRVDLYDHRLVVGVSRTRPSLGNRVRRGRSLRSSMKPTIAAAMLRLAGAHSGAGRLIDPLCGAGVIPVEAATTNPSLEIVASDWDTDTVETARGTLANHGIPLEVTTADARELDPESDGRFDYIVTDPPHGLRQARRARLDVLYAELLAAFERVLAPDGRIAIIVVKYRLFTAAVQSTGLRIVEHRAVTTGNVQQRIFVLAHGDYQSTTL
ncbi:MAG: methyltransferase [Acidobacteriota bacterium]|nr:methyltransferase [Acidobacteriota bacterium]MDH3784980.1 methyltransferase [Acidobacteriota bacterium]